MERHEGEGMTEFTIRRVRDEIIETCAKAAEDAIPSIQDRYGMAETVGAHIAARRIRALKSIYAEER